MRTQKLAVVLALAVGLGWTCSSQAQVINKGIQGAKGKPGVAPKMQVPPGGIRLAQAPGGVGKATWVDHARLWAPVGTEAFNAVRTVRGSRGTVGRRRGRTGSRYSAPVHKSTYPPFNTGPSYIPRTSDTTRAAASVPSNALPSGSSTGGGQEVTIVNPPATGGRVRFRVDSQAVNLDSGYEQSFPSDVVVTFDRGGQFGSARYSLSGGFYHFKLTNGGWDLVKKVFQVTIDNLNGQSAFRYTVDGRVQMVAAGAANTHKGATPLVVKFDNGSGGQPTQMILDGGRWYVGVDPETGRWDLMTVASSGAASSNPTLAETSVLANPLP